MLKAATTIGFTNAALNLAELASARTDVTPNLAAQDEDFWMQIQEGFTLDRTFANFNNGGVSPSPRVVQEAMRRYLEYSNQAPSYLMWRNLEPEVENVRRRLATMFGVSPDEIAITRNASESLETCLLGFDFEPGDEILTSDLDYPRMITTIQQRERRDGIKMVQVKVPPTPKSRSEIIEAFRNGITSKTKLILCSQVVFLNGQINPIKEIVALSRKHNIPCIVDGAHAFAHFPFQHKNLECDYYGTSLHKWLMAPIGTGMLYVNKFKIKDLWSMMASTEAQSSDIRKYEEIGTHPAANHNAIAEALTFNELIGIERKAARLRYLRKLWTEDLKNESRVKFHTVLEPEFSCGLTTVEIEGIEPGDLATWLLEKKGIFVTGISHESFKGIRVSPNVYSTREEIFRFRDAMIEACRHGILP